MSATLQPAKQAPTPGAGVPTIWLDGKWYDRETATVSVYDHGLLYGDGVFEGIRIYGGKIFRLAEHLERLYDSAHAIWLTVPMPREEMAAVTEEAVRRSGITEGYIRHIVTRGVGDLGLDPRKCPRPSIIIIVDTIKLWPEEVYETGPQGRHRRHADPAARVALAAGQVAQLPGAHPRQDRGRAGRRRRSAHARQQRAASPRARARTSSS